MSCPQVAHWISYLKPRGLPEQSPESLTEPFRFHNVSKWYIQLCFAFLIFLPLGIARGLPWHYISSSTSHTVFPSLLCPVLASASPFPTRNEARLLSLKLLQQLLFYIFERFHWNRWKEKCLFRGIGFPILKA